ncbi:GcrA family cell cycle regulator [Roseococcus sp. DSY-14]|uniref:GcrA family cell cycle regulator n=1 Tax=Roseococcus sp. DSY-14 TaxID=3369650 RepID=UPI00387B04B1
MDWTNEAIDRLRAFWAEGLSTAEIGRRMGISKNAVVGKAHRLQLPARPSPIRRDAPAARPATAGRRPTLPPLHVAAAPAPAVPAPPRREAPVAAAPRPVLAPPAVVRPFPRASARSCCWPIGEPGTEGFRFCTAEAMAPKPYCAEHAALAYVRVKDRREDAA